MRKFLFALALMIAVGPTNVAASGCGQAFLFRDAAPSCQAALKETFESIIIQGFNRNQVNIGNVTSIIGSCSCIDDEELVSCTASYQMNNCVTLPDGTKLIPHSPTVAGQHYSDWVINPGGRDARGSAMQSVLSNATEGAANKLLNEIQSNF